MKKIISLFVLAFLFNSCEEDVKFSNPAVQGKLDNVLWRAIDFQATTDLSGALTLNAYTSNQELNLKTPSKNPGVYVLGENSARSASFTTNFSGETLIYSTGSGIGGDGEIVITEFDGANNTVTGTFRFNAVNIENNPLGGELLNMQNGVFYKIPVFAAQ
ncbi:DUF6252 family protein [Flavobacterium orientale]|uniref:Uncharacterized protein n=1 Tax=Flavobacterium orientale TaxID=1756020 RepID=A0A916XXH4_9FLAO|nr:DUF6252 family protein [Flavobacterium orientale]GGD19544.1 hypothetical protein GCM10011343_07600 [Flavobacterium orientale]